MTKRDKHDYHPPLGEKYRGVPKYPSAPNGDFIAIPIEEWRRRQPKVGKKSKDDVDSS